MFDVTLDQWEYILDDKDLIKQHLPSSQKHSQASFLIDKKTTITTNFMEYFKNNIHKPDFGNISV